ncbi:polyisoprenyl-teichoic acid--peptidoglycan teichoic acid transferase TagU [Bacillus sp. B-jedd]|uniref:polyisoprenyl-teichoic acid--peptidoglycan teichoic acid transferase TagU n=1 Tax=Bacillus sp. B-jedd TaxID=1476857 RepID=UPI0005156357|nr:LytR family transcriptional regulator [Bacillus sp. B-jedd]CEG29103.1 membrane-bound protein transcriptional regulator LytR [Bacillus sp. B-jedd]
MSSRLEAKKTVKKKRKWVKVLLISFLVLFLGVGAYVYSIYHSLNNAVDTMHQKIDRKSDKRNTALSIKDGDPFSVLLLGVDQRKNDRGRSDSIIVLTINPNKNSVKMLSIPRDTRTEIIGRGTQDKINHAYAFGGVEMSMDTVEHFLDIPIDYFVQVNMEGFQDIVNAVGGVKVQNNSAFTSQGVNFAQGELNLNGKEALAYTQMRKQDPRGDFGRQERQRQIIQGIIREGASLKSLANYGDIFEALGNNVRTNLTFDEMMTIQSKYKSAAKDIQQIELKGQGVMLGPEEKKIYYYQVPDGEKEKVQSLLKEHLKGA